MQHLLLHQQRAVHAFDACRFVHAWACIYIRVYTRCTKFNSNLVDHCIRILYILLLNLVVVLHQAAAMQQPRSTSGYSKLVMNSQKHVSDTDNE
jgi:hypothetical protein